MNDKFNGMLYDNVPNNLFYFLTFERWVLLKLIESEANILYSLVTKANTKEKCSASETCI